MSYKSDFLPNAVSLVEEFGFKFYKSKNRGIGRYGKFEFEIVIVGDEASVEFNCSVCHKTFSILDFEITGSNYWDTAIINILTSHAFPNWKDEPKNEYYGVIYFDKYYMGMKENALSYEDAKKEFERLFTKFILPWFEKHKTFEGIRQTYRNGALNGIAFEKAWHNIEFTPRTGDGPGGIFQMFFIDAIITKLLEDDKRPVIEIYNEFYRAGYEKKWSEIDEETGKPYIELDRIKIHFNDLTEIMQKIEAVSPAEWEEYRKKVL